MPNRDSMTIPEMRIGGVWLAKLGFNVGDHVQLDLQRKQIVIRLEEIPNMVEEAPGTVIPD